jgi:hypothetical protein
MYEDYLKRFDSLSLAPVARPAAPRPAASAAAVPEGPAPAPADNPTIRRIVNEARMDFHAVRDRHGTTLAQVNSELAQVDCGPLVAVAISRAAREPGPIADFLIDIGLNPFDDWNMLYYASDAPSAQLMGARLFAPGIETQFDAEFTATIEAARRRWIAYHGAPEASDPAAVQKVRAELRQSLEAAGEAVKSETYGDCANRWQNLFPRKAR